MQGDTGLGYTDPLVYGFENVFHKAIDTIHGYTLVKDVQNMALGILFFSVLYVLFQAWLRGRDVRHLGRGLLIFALVCPVLYNYHEAYLAVVNGFLDLARYINSAVGGRDTLANWRFELSSTYSETTWWGIIGSGVSHLIALVLNFCAYVVFPFSMLAFSFAFLTVGSLLYILGPLFLATLPLSGLTPLGKAYMRNLLAFCLWPLMYAALNVLIEASTMHNIAGVSGGFLQGDAAGGDQSFFIAFATIIYALMVMFIPLIVNRFLAGDTGSALFSMAGTLAMMARATNLRGRFPSKGGSAAGGGGSGRAGLSGGAAAVPGSGGGSAPQPPPRKEVPAMDQVGQWTGRSPNQSRTSAGHRPETPPMPRGKYAY